MSTDFRDVVIEEYGYDKPQVVTVVVGDGVTVYDEDFPYDHRVFFYFTDEAEFLEAWADDNVMCEFKILGMADDWAGVAEG